MGRTASLVFLAALLFGVLSVLVLLISPEPSIQEEFAITCAGSSERGYIGFVSAVFTFSLFVAGAILAFDDQRENLKPKCSILGLETVKPLGLRSGGLTTQSTCERCGQTLSKPELINDGLTPLERVLRA